MFAVLKRSFISARQPAVEEEQRKKIPDFKKRDGAFALSVGPSNPILRANHMVRSGSFLNLSRRQAPECRPRRPWRGAAAVLGSARLLAASPLIASRRETVFRSSPPLHLHLTFGQRLYHEPAALRFLLTTYLTLINQLARSFALLQFTSHFLLLAIASCVFKFRLESSSSQKSTPSRCLQCGCPTHKVR